MLVTFISKKNLAKLTLPKTIFGSYWLNDANKKIINIEANGKEWVMKSNSYCKIINEKNIIFKRNILSYIRDGEEFLPEIELKENYFYYLTFVNNPEVYLIYCSPTVEDNFLHLHIDNATSIFIGRNPKKNHISYDISFVSDRQARIFFFNGMWQVENYDKNFNTFVNDEPVSNTTKLLFNGDVVFIYGLKIILIGRELFINNPFARVHCNKNYFSIVEDNDKISEIDDDDSNLDFENNYFIRPPRLLDVIKETEVQMIRPNLEKKSREIPAAVAMLTSLTIGVTSIVTLITTINNIRSGKTQLSSAITSLITSITMLVGSLFVPILTRMLNKRIKKLNKRDYIENYKKYIYKKNQAIDEILARDRSILYSTYVSVEECVEIIYNKSRLWERTIFDSDFLTVRLGIGDINSKILIYIDKSEKIEPNIELEELQDMYDKCIDNAKVIKNAPKIYSLLDNNISAILYNDENVRNKFVKNLLLQLVTFQSYDELKLVFLLNDNENKQWDFVKLLPHLWNNSRDMRFFGDKLEEIDIICQYLQSEYKKRTSNEEMSGDYRNFNSYYLIIIDDYKAVRNIGFIENILKSEKNMGFSLLFLTDEISKLPNECRSFIQIGKDNGFVFRSNNYIESRTSFKQEDSEIVSFSKISQLLFDLQVKSFDEGNLALPDNLGFLEMFNASNIDQLNILDRWKKNDSTISLSAQLGVDGEGKKICLDIHEKYDGPHGLIAGSTGSGKSEFIITYILSLAINYHPDDVTFVLIDYKGGGLTGAFLKPDVKLPHLVGTITNIDKSSLQRSLEAIQSELKKRQMQFNEAKIITNESTIDIYKYQKYYHKGVLKTPISHLFIISDEFAELKQQEPEFMDELVSVARIGRSLGVHLILATQKPSGVVNEQIRSNSKFGICLKVQTPNDSKEIVGTGDAAKLTSAGQFYIKVGSEDYIALGKSAYTGLPYLPSDEVKKEYDESLEFISSTGKTLKKMSQSKKVAYENKGDELTNIVKYLNDLAERENIHKEKLWLDPIPPTIYVDDIRKKYKVKVNEREVCPVIGEYDNPAEQKQEYMALNLYSGGNVLIYGNAESGKETLVSTMIYDIINNYFADAVQMYILDFGSETMKIFKDSANVGDVVFIKEAEKISRFFAMIQNELKERKNKLSQYNGDYELYLKKTKKPLPVFVTILNNYESFTEEYKEKFNDVIEVALREGLKYKMVFVFTLSASNSLRYRTTQHFKQKIALQMNKDDEYLNIFDRIGKKRPSPLFGRGLVNPSEKNYYEFQTAKICDSEIWNEKIIETIEARNKLQKSNAREVETIPDIVTVNYLMPALTDFTAFPIGVLYKSIKPCTINLKDNFITLMVANNIEKYADFIGNMIELLKLLPNMDVTVLDSYNLLKTKETIEENEIRNLYIMLFSKLNNTKTTKDNIIVIIGLDRLIAELGGNEDVFFESIKNAQTLKNCYYIILDSSTKMSAHIRSRWYPKYLNGENGIWLGDGVSSQYLLKTRARLSDNCGQTFGYYYSEGEAELIKLLGMIDKNKEEE